MTGKRPRTGWHAESPTGPQRSSIGKTPDPTTGRMAAHHICRHAAIFRRAAPLVIAAPFLATMIVGTLVLVHETSGIGDEQIIRPTSFSLGSTTVFGSHKPPVRHARDPCHADCALSPTCQFHQRRIIQQDRQRRRVADHLVDQISKQHHRRIRRHRGDIGQNRGARISTRTGAFPPTACCRQTPEMSRHTGDRERGSGSRQCPRSHLPA